MSKYNFTKPLVSPVYVHKLFFGDGFRAKHLVVCDPQTGNLAGLATTKLFPNVSIPWGSNFLMPTAANISDPGFYKVRNLVNFDMDKAFLLSKIKMLQHFSYHDTITKQVLTQQQALGEVQINYKNPALRPLKVGFASQEAQARLNCVHHDFKTHYGIYNQTKQVLLENTALELSKELSTHGINLEAKNLLTLEPLPIEIENFCQTEVTSLLLSSIVMNFFPATDW